MTFYVKLIRFHNGVMRSRKIFEPLAGGFGSSREAGLSRSSRLAATQAGITALAQASRNATRVMAGWNASAMRGHGEAVTIRMVHDNRQYRMPGRHADDGADGGGGESVEQELLHDVSVAVAERLQDAGIGALLIHHAVHGGQHHQRGHKVEEHGKDHRQFLDDVRDDFIHAVALGSQAFAPPID